MNLELHVAQSRSYNIYSVITELWAHRINLFIRLMSLALEFVDYDTYRYVLKLSTLFIDNRLFTLDRDQLIIRNVESGKF